jgi:amidophosphoribosyltransferase
MGGGAPEVAGLDLGFADAAGVAAGIRHKCGVFAVHGHPDPVRLTYYALFALQHRGQEAAGIAAADGSHLEVRRGLGLVSEALRPGDIDALAAGQPAAAIGHVRYSTTGASTLANAQPLLLHFRAGPVAIAHNGNLTNASVLRGEYEASGSIFQTSSDTEIIAHLMARSGEGDLRDALLFALDRIEGAYSLAVQSADRIWVCRDPHGIRPMVLGQLDGALVAASETCALDAVGATPLRSLQPGEVAEFGPAGLRVVRRAPSPGGRLCLFEFIYLARPDSELQGTNVHLVRKAMGRSLARQSPVEADVVVGVPDSGISAAVGYAEEAGVPYELGLIKNRYIGRTFIQPTQALREVGVRMKLNAVPAVVSGRRVVLVEDSVVRGTTSRHLVGLVRRAGAREVHLRVASPPFVHPCYYGIDIPTQDELLAPGRTVEDMARIIGADSLAFLDLDAAQEAAGGGGFCHACFSGQYPVNPRGAEGSRGQERGAAGWRTTKARV